MNRILDLTSPVFCVLLGIGCAVGWLLWKKRNWKIRYWVIPVFLCYVLMLIKLTLFPIHIFDKETLDAIKSGAGKYLMFYQVIPFASIQNYFRTGAMVQLIGNIVLLSPLVLFVEIFLRQRPKAWKVALSVFCVSLLIELSQLAINFLTGHPTRVADVDDLLLNGIGVIFTVLLTRCIGKSQRFQGAIQKLFYREGKRQ